MKPNKIYNKYQLSINKNIERSFKLESTNHLLEKEAFEVAKNKIGYDRLGFDGCHAQHGPFYSQNDQIWNQIDQSNC